MLIKQSKKYYKCSKTFGRDCSKRNLFGDSKLITLSRNKRHFMYLPHGCKGNDVARVIGC